MCAAFLASNFFTTESVEWNDEVNLWDLQVCSHFSPPKLQSNIRNLISVRLNLTHDEYDAIPNLNGNPNCEVVSSTGDGMTYEKWSGWSQIEMSFGRTEHRKVSHWVSRSQRCRQAYGDIYVRARRKEREKMRNVCDGHVHEKRNFFFFARIKINNQNTPFQPAARFYAQAERKRKRRKTASVPVGNNRVQ